MDIYPTLTELAGIKPPAELEGRSLHPLLENPLAKWDGSAITQVLRPADDRLSEPVMGRSIRTQRWRYSDWGEESMAWSFMIIMRIPWSSTTLPSIRMLPRVQ